MARADVIKQRQCCEYFAARAHQSRTYGRFTVTTLDAAKVRGVCGWCWVGVVMVCMCACVGECGERSVNWAGSSGCAGM